VTISFSNNILHHTRE